MRYAADCGRSQPNASKGEVRQQEEAIFNTFEKVDYDWHTNNKCWSVGYPERVQRNLERNIFPAIEKRNIADLVTRVLLLPLKEVEHNGRLDVASRLQQRITGIMHYAVQIGITDRNPA